MALGRTRDRDTAAAPPGGAPAGATPPTRILLAGTGAPFDRALIDRVVELAAGTTPRVLVLSIAKIWGTSLGLPNPGLYPTKREVDQQKRLVEDAAKLLRRRGFDVRTKVIAARRAHRTIAQFADHARVKAIVVPEPPAGRIRRVVEGTAAGEVSRRTRIPVHGVPTASPPRRRWGAG